MSYLNEILKKSSQQSSYSKSTNRKNKRDVRISELVSKVRNKQQGPEGPKGDSPSTTELLSLIKPLIPRPVPGQPGRTPTANELRSLIKPLIPNPLPGPQGPQGIPGIQGDTGPMGPIPKHEWDGTKIRFEKPGKKWGKFIDLQGPSGSQGIAGDSKNGRLIKGGGASHFHLLSDTPDRVALGTPYQGYEDYYVKVNSAGTAFEYKDIETELDNKITGVNTSKLTLSTTEPADPEVGDLWVVKV